jgi:hypothetical protein
MDASCFPSYALGEISRGELVAAHHLGGDVWARCGRGRCDERRGLARDRERDPAGVPPADKTARLDPRLAASLTRTVRVELLAARPAEARALVTRHGGRVKASYEGVIEAVVPTPSLRALSRSGPVRVVREPARPVPESVRGQGALSTGATAWHGSGAHGEGVKVAVVDFGFDGYARSQANGDLPSSAVRVNFCGSGGFEATSHGTAVAEIVAEVAPAADLYLVCVRSVAGLGLAVGYARAKGIQIVNHSASWFNTGRGDGPARPGRLRASSPPREPRVSSG